MIGTPPSTWRVLRLLARSAALRLLRAAQIARSARAQKQGRPGSKRTATARRSGRGLGLLMVLMLPLMLLNSLVVTSRGTTNFASQVNVAAQGAQPLVVHWRTMIQLHLWAESWAAAAEDPERRAQLAGDFRAWLAEHPDRHVRDTNALVTRFRDRGPAGFTNDDHSDGLLAEPVTWGDDGARTTFASGGALLLLALTLLLVAVGLGGANLELGRAEWSFPWLLTFPVPTHAIVLAKVLEYSVVTILPWLTVFPLAWQLLRVACPGDLVWPVALLATLCCAALAGALRFLCETWLRLSLPVQRVRSVQGLFTLVAMGGLALVFSIVMAETTPAWFGDAARATPVWIPWVVTAWPMAVHEHGLTALLVGPLLCSGLVALATFAAVRLLRNGAERTSGVDPGVRRRDVAAAPSGGLTVVGKELKLLARDRNFAVQTLVVPLFILGLQLLLNRHSADLSGKAGIILAYSVGMMALTGGCFSVLSNEGRALWLLYCQPVALQDVLRRKVQLWGLIAVAFTAVAIVVMQCLRAGPVEPGKTILDAVSVLAGVFSAAWLAAGIGALGVDPAADHVPKQPKARYVYLYFYLAGSYCLGLASDLLSARFAALLVFGTLAWSLWQRVKDRLPWLLDPGVRGNREISAYDAGAAVVTFFLLQGLIATLSGLAGQVSGFTLLVSYAIAGLCSCLIFGLVLSHRGLPVLELLGLSTQGRRRPLLLTALAAGLGVALGYTGLAYQRWIMAQDWFEMPPNHFADASPVVLVLLACVAAPLCEEILFRGFLLNGLRRSVPTWLAVVWSALLFAVVHPVPGWPMVFLLGCATAMVFLHGRFLPAAMAVHATYNLVVVLGQS